MQTHSFIVTGVISLSHYSIRTTQKCVFKAVSAIQESSYILVEKAKEMNIATPPEVRNRRDVISSLGNRKFSIVSIVVE